jgi:hypothetical protein
MAYNKILPAFIQAKILLLINFAIRIIMDLLAVGTQIPLNGDF